MPKRKISKDQFTLFKSPSKSSPLWYIGGKSKLYNKLYERGNRLLPEGLTEMMSPFIGGGALELKLAATGVRVHAYDKFEPLVNYWKCMLSDPGKVICNIYKYLPLFAKYYSTYDEYPPHQNATEPYELADNAAAFWCLNRGSYSGITLAKRGTSHNPDKKSPATGFFYTWYDFHSPNLSVECLPFEESLAKHDGVFAYLDPPYVGREHLYGDGRAGKPSFDHENLCAILKDRKSKWMLSYQPDDVVIELYKDFNIHEIPWTYFCQPVGDNPKGDKKEIIITNY